MKPLPTPDPISEEEIKSLISLEEEDSYAADAGWSDLHDEEEGRLRDDLQLTPKGDRS